MDVCLERQAPSRWSGGSPYNRCVRECERFGKSYVVDLHKALWDAVLCGAKAVSDQEMLVWRCKPPPVGREARPTTGVLPEREWFIVLREGCGRKRADRLEARPATGCFGM